MDKPETPGVIAPPPLIYLAGVVIGVILRNPVPTPILPRGLGYGLGAVLILTAVSISLWGVQVMRRAGTAVNPRIPTTTLVTTGPFRFSRNPLYVSLTLCYLGIAIAAQSLWTLALLPVVLAVMQYGVIYREERYLEGRFGAEYIRYRKRVRRWL
ncbi:MAG TPA: isoprenylcysteine carboxylmethyltransferase family protein [Nitrospiraceae bacterium]|nr:isoprenylcysteine carboxylmethyltransferase family protein [Nitrospiraceae bacterium]